MKLFLASRSPRRKELLEEWGYEFETVERENDEERACGGSAEELATARAAAKARSAARGLAEGVVLAADTVVEAGGAVLGKPRGAADAERMLKALSGTRHAVVTGVCLLRLPDGPERLASERTEILMRELSEEEVREYVRSGEWRGKAGGYAIQESGDAFLRIIRGSETNVVGLPMELVAGMLEEWGVEIRRGERGDGNGPGHRSSPRPRRSAVRREE